MLVSPLYICVPIMRKGIRDPCARAYTDAIQLNYRDYRGAQERPLLVGARGMAGIPAYDPGLCNDVPPNGLHQLTLGDDAACMLHQKVQNLETFGPRLYLPGRSLQAKPIKVERERPKLNRSGSHPCHRN
jgi:hypothetical protein